MFSLPLDYVSLIMIKRTLCVLRYSCGPWGFDFLPLLAHKQGLGLRVSHSHRVEAHVCCHKDALNGLHMCPGVIMLDSVSL